jgi:hypothetical protein
MLLPFLSGAISGGGSGATVRASATGSVNGGKTVSVTIPASTVVGDLLLAVVGTIGGSGESASGWTQVNRTVAGSSNFAVYILFRRTAQSGDAGSTVTFTVSPVVDTWGSVVLMSVANPLGVVSVHGHTATTGSTSTLTTNAPTARNVKNPLRFDVFLQSTNTTPTFSSYTGQGSLVASTSSTFSGLSVYQKADAWAYTDQASVSSNQSQYNSVSTAFNV